MSLRVRVNVSLIVYAFLFSFLVFHYSEPKAASVQLDFSNGWSLTFDDNITNTQQYGGVIQYYGDPDFANYVIPRWYENYESSYTNWYESSSLSRIQFREGFYKRNGCSRWSGCSFSRGYHQITLQKTDDFLFSMEQDIADVLVSALNVENLFTRRVKCSSYYSPYCSQKVTLERIFIDDAEQFKQASAVPTPSAILLMLTGFVGLIIQRKFT